MSEPRATLVIGATSSIMEALCRELAKDGHRLILAGRDEEELQTLASDLTIRFKAYCDALTVDLLAGDFSPYTLIERAGEFDDVIIGVGDMGNGDADDLANLVYVTRLNYTAPAQIASACARHLSEKGGGQIVIISSVAGDRGRQGIYAYGAAKAALTAFASGMRARFYKEHVHVMTVKPGFVDTPMTWGMKSKLVASREYVAKEILRAMKKKKDAVYVPFFWRWIMLIIVHIPERIFKRLKL